MTPIAYDAVILGAGAAGLWCGAVLAASGRRAAIVDHAAEPARKVRLSGGGKCNVTNLALTWEDYWGENPVFCRSALTRFTPEALIRRLEDAGIALEERDHSQIFCRRSAQDVVELLVRGAQGCGLRFSRSISGVERLPGGGFLVRTSREALTGRVLIIALGNAAWPQAGASVRGLELAGSLGHRIIPPRPALAGIALPDASPLRGLQGISVNASVRRLPAGGAKGLPAKAALPAENLSLLFTHKGFSGPAGLQASVYLEPDDELSLDFLPGTPLAGLLEKAGPVSCLGLLKRLLPDRLAEALCPPELADRRSAELSRPARDALCRAAHEHRTRPVGTEDFRKAEAARGGVDTREVSSKSMESSQAPGLFFCGEVLDVVGRLGGFNLHWAFASAEAAAAGALERLDKEQPAPRLSTGPAGAMFCDAVP